MTDAQRSVEPARAEVVPRRPRPGLGHLDTSALTRTPSPALIKAAPNVARVAAVSTSVATLQNSIQLREQYSKASFSTPLE